MAAAAAAGENAAVSMSCGGGSGGSDTRGPDACGSRSGSLGVMGSSRRWWPSLRPMATALAAAGSAVAFAGFVDDALCRPGFAPLGSPQSPSAAVAAPGDGGGVGAALQRGQPHDVQECLEWVSSHPWEAMRASGFLGAPTTVMLVPLAAHIGLTACLGPHFKGAFRDLLVSTSRIGVRTVLAFSVLTSARGGAPPSPLVLYVVYTRRMILGSMFASAVCKVMQDLPFAVWVLCELADLALNLLAIWLLSCHDGFEHTWGPGVVVSAAAAALVIPTVIAAARWPVGRWLEQFLAPHRAAQRGRVSRKPAGAASRAAAAVCAAAVEGAGPSAVGCAARVRPSPAACNAADPAPVAASSPITGLEVFAVFDAERPCEAGAPASGVNPAAQPYSLSPAVAARIAASAAMVAGSPAAYKPLYGPTVRLSIKVHNREPEDLVGDWRGQVLAHVGEAAPGARVRGMAVRRGCTHLLLEVDADGADELLDSLQQGSIGQGAGASEGRAPHITAARELLGALFAPAAGPLQPDATFSRMDLAAHVALSGGSDAPAAARRQKQQVPRPPSVASVTPLVLPMPAAHGGVVEVDLVLSAPLQPGHAVVLRHCIEGYLRVHGVEPLAAAGGPGAGKRSVPACAPPAGGDDDGGLVRLRVQFSAPLLPGRVQAEVLDDAHGLIGMPATLLLVNNAAAADELAMLCRHAPVPPVGRIRGAAAATAAPVHRPHPMLLDAGLWIDAAMLCVHVTGAGALADSQADAVGRGMLEYTRLVGLSATHDMLAGIAQQAAAAAGGSAAAAATAADAACHPDERAADRAEPGAKQTHADGAASARSGIPRRATVAAAGVRRAVLVALGAALSLLLSSAGAPLLLLLVTAPLAAVVAMQELAPAPALAGFAGAARCGGSCDAGRGHAKSRLK